MPTGFLSLPGEIRNIIYNHLLVCDEPLSIDPEWSWVHDYGIALNFCLTNKTIKHETESVLFGRNCFYFTGSEYSEAVELTSKFLNEIGRNKANLIRCVEIEFPRIVYTEYDYAALRPEDEMLISEIKIECTNLERLVMSLPYVLLSYMEVSRASRIAAKGLALIDAEIKAYPPFLREVIVEVYEGCITEDIKMDMEARGWTVDVKGDPCSEMLDPDMSDGWEVDSFHYCFYECCTSD
ncbi:hypothetical protein FQN54_008384 [Arachnomyces sp. PD_36]|nr:hypothetical protein FQN54_008384 [Arachnomyces sp. PD_36]